MSSQSPRSAQPASNNRSAAKPKKKKGMSFWNILGIALLVIIIIGSVGAGIFIGWAAEVLRDLPDLNADLLLSPPMASTIYDRNGNELVELASADNYRKVIPFSDIPEYLRKAVISSEDHSFYSHIGVDIVGTGRMLLFGGSQGGGSTITQQLARNVYLTLEATYERKLREMVLAINMERIYSKDEILYFYLNQVFFGHHAKGVQAAAELYFAKDVKDLNLAESAMLAGLLPSPNEYSPYVSFESAKKMQGIVLDLMVEHKAITPEEARLARETEIVLGSMDIQEVEMKISSSSHFTDFVIENFPYLLADTFGGYDEALNALYVGGLKIMTTLDSDLQAETEASIQRTIDQEINTYGRSAWTWINEETGMHERQVAAVIVAPETGEVVTMVGGRTYPEDTSMAFNRALSYRQPGSAIKPLIDYAPALQRKVITVATVFDDVPTAWAGATGPWHPTNFDNAYYGLINIREAVVRSQNIPAIKTLQALGAEHGVAFLRNAGFEGIADEEYLSAAIGGMAHGVSVLEMASAYAAFMNNGVYTHPIYIKEVRDRNNTVIFRGEPRRTVLLDEATNYLMIDIMRSVVNLPYGTGRVGRFDVNRQIAAKSGTTDDFFDIWFCGGTVDYASALWIGHDVPEDMYDLYGTGVHPKMWAEYMKYAHEDLPYRTWTEPTGISHVSVCTVSGKRPSDICPMDKIATELFLRGTEPATSDTCTTHIQLKIDITNNKIATPNTPAAQTETRTFIRRAIPWYPLPYGNAPADAQFEAPREYSENVTTGGNTNTSGESNPSGGRPSTPGGSTSSIPSNNSIPSSSLPSRPTNSYSSNASLPSESIVASHPSSESTNSEESHPTSTSSEDSRFGGWATNTTDDDSQAVKDDDEIIEVIETTEDEDGENEEGGE